MPSVVNRGRLINFINGIAGVSAGGNAVVNMPVNQRYHRNVLQCTAINYSAATTVVMGAAGGTLATFTPTIVNGVITAIAIATAGSGQTPGTYSLTITDVTGTGATATAVVAGGGTVTATPTVTSGGTPSAISPVTMITSIRQLVNGVNMRDISATEILKISIAQNGNPGAPPRLGELPLIYTAPWRNVNQQNELGSWDLFGQSTFQMQIGISPNVVSPGLTGVSEFDYLRNVMPGNKPGELVPFLQPTAQHSFTYNGISGRNDINTLPFNYPISRMWIQGATPGSITQVEVYQDGNKILEATIEQIKEMYAEYGILFGQPDYLNASYASTAALKTAFQAPLYFDCAYISDPDQRQWKALSCANSMILRVYSSVAQALTVTMETLPGSFSS